MKNGDYWTSTATLQALAREAPKAQAGGVGAQQNQGRPSRGRREW